VVLNRLFRRRSAPDPKIEQGLKKTRRGIFADITALFDRSAIDEELFEDLESLLIQADLGVETTVELVEALREDIRRERITDPQQAKLYLRDQMVKLLEHATRNRKLKIYQRGVPFVTLVVGVNGTGKTTTIAKLAHFHRQRNRNVILVAGDTFRAAAIDQLKIWGDRLVFRSSPTNREQTPVRSSLTACRLPMHAMQISSWWILPAGCIPSTT
jgi:fused signal recognition particle receptor